MSNSMRLNLIVLNVGGLGQNLKDSEFHNILIENDIICLREFIGIGRRGEQDIYLVASLYIIKICCNMRITCHDLEIERPKKPTNKEFVIV